MDTHCPKKIAISLHKTEPVSVETDNLHIHSLYSTYMYYTEENIFSYLKNNNLFTLMDLVLLYMHNSNNVYLATVCVTLEKQSFILGITVKRLFFAFKPSNSLFSEIF